MNLTLHQVLAQLVVQRMRKHMVAEETHGGGQIQGYIKEPEVKLDLCITNIGTIHNTFVLVIAARLYNCSNHLATLFSG